MKVSCIQFEMSEARKQTWKEILPDKSFVFESLPDLPSEWQKQAQLYLLSPEVSVPLLEQFERLPEETRAVKGFDCLVHLQTRWWPRLYSKSALKFMILQRSPFLNTQGMAYVTGVGVQARTAVSVLLELGFGRLRVVWPEKEEAEIILAQLRSRYFSVDIQWLGDEELTLQPNNGSILINTRDHSENQTLVDDLSYLNFLQKDGLVAEFWHGKGVNRILQEAQNIGQQGIRAEELNAALDAHLWADLLNLQKEKQSQFVFKWMEKFSHLESPTKV